MHCKRHLCSPLTWSVYIHVACTNLNYGLTLLCRRQIVEYVYFALAMAVCLTLAISVLTNCPFLASSFTFVLLVLTLIYSIVAAVLYLAASIGNDA